jgi:hypothetical protein
MQITLTPEMLAQMGITYSDNLVLTLPLWKGGIMGRPGSGKSHLLASLPKPMLVLAADPIEKLTPYLDRGIVREEVFTGQFGQPVYIVDSVTTGKPIIQIESYYDDEPKIPRAFTSLMARSEQLKAEVKAQGWATVGFDSWSLHETFAVYRRQTGPFATGNPDGRAAYNAAKDDLKSIVVSRLMPLPCNVGIVFHTTETMQEEGGLSFFGMKAIGTLKTDLAAVLPERYRAVAESDGVTRKLYTRPDGRFDLCTLIDAPNPCTNDFRALFTNWIAKKAAMVVAAKASATAAAEPQKENV